MAFFRKRLFVIAVSIFGIGQAWSHDSTTHDSAPVYLYPSDLPRSTIPDYFYDEVQLTEETESNYFDSDGGFTSAELSMLKKSKAENYEYLSNRLSTEETLSIWIGINPAGLPLRKKGVLPTKQFKEYEKNARKDVIDKILLSLEKTSRKEPKERAASTLLQRGAFKLKVNQVELDILNDNPEVVWFTAVKFESSEQARLRRESEPDPFDTENQPDLEPGDSAELIEYFQLITPENVARIKHQMRQNNSEFWRVSLIIDIKGKPNTSTLKSGVIEDGRLWVRDKLLPVISSLPSGFYSKINSGHKGIRLNVNKTALDIIRNRDEIISILDYGEPNFTLSLNRDHTYSC